MVAHAVVTGARGFIGAALVNHLLEAGWRVTALQRNAAAAPSDHASPLLTRLVVRDNFEGIDQIWPEAVDCVVHLAARVHQKNEQGEQVAAAYQASNCEAALRIGALAKARGAKRLLFVSSIKALGEVEPGRPFRESDEPAPQDVYGHSKLAAEQALRALEQPGFAVTVLRFPLVYGPGVRANFAQLARAVRQRRPLPLGQARAPRSLLGLENAISALTLCLTHPAAAGRTFHVADQETPTVRELVLELAAAFNQPARLFNVPVPLLVALAHLARRADSLQRLITPLRLDTTQIRQTLGWSPPLSLAAGLAHYARATPNP